jgi:type I restriction enzyme M protein
MDSIEYYKPELRGSLPKDEYYRLTRTPETKHLPFDLLRQFDNIPDDASGDMFGQIYEYFLGNFAHGRRARAAVSSSRRVRWCG